MKVIIIGYGVVGKNMHKLFPGADTYDISHGPRPKGFWDVAFVCVPTDLKTDDTLDTGLVDSVLKVWQDDVDTFCIKSTVPVGYTTEKVNQGHRAIFSPEYFGGTAHANAIKKNFVILGGLNTLATNVAEVYKKQFSAYLEIYKTTSETAELVKLMENTWIATKVTFVNEMAQIANRLGVDNDTLRQLWLLDDRISPSHTFVYKDQPYWDSHCLNKDVPALAQIAKTQALYTPHLIDAVIKTNDLTKKLNSAILKS
jgi:UDPglucose 6-dehydrogenase